MAVRIGLMGFGHIGRNLFRILYKRDDLRVEALCTRLANGTTVREVILATNPSMEGEVTATYVRGVVERPGIRVTRIALGLPVGGDLEYADSVTIARALAARREMAT